jgi:hypothetical protein
MHHILYVSQAKTEISDTEHSHILEIARNNNEKHDITGMLLSQNGNFVQLLEGSRDALMPLYGKICSDPRHGDITTLYYEPCKKRIFSYWSMAHKKPEDFDSDLGTRVKALMKLHNAEDLKKDGLKLLDLLQDIRYSI